MSTSGNTNTYTLGTRSVRRLGYGAMQLAGPGVFGPPKDPAAAQDVLRAVVESGIDHIDTADIYGPHVTNRLIHAALAPYADDLTIVTKVGARRGVDASWIPAFAPEELVAQIYQNLGSLGLGQLEVVNVRLMFDPFTPTEGPIEAQVEALAKLREQGLIRHIGLSNATAAQIAAARRIVPIVCVQNFYNLAHRDDDALIDALAADGIAYVPFFPLGGFSPLQSSTLTSVAAELGATPMQVAIAWLLQRSPNILLIPGTSSLAHLKENIAASGLELPADAIARLDGIAAQAA
ncbi:aryl-alcohol dehydrogenase-like predicted oxidoreductase [Kaistia hirudinis]|uniref:Aryl-alcohol dehydrogenase-like predicted oxidoreductase n=1 Tax=Kaistia hirudinis TaxID=1293440 RepID=A0A840AS24_9HYPH|nr:oxidoreductase [Kaistia hirudinis]MBB3933190.1 aryl-alcohol dehydrogenase-like predicted oxidoreductase [Kaistia hirudinis]